MSPETPPPTKKIKISEDIDNFIDKLWNSKENLKAVLSDDIADPIPSVEVYAGYVKDKKKISQTILILNEKLPLKKLQHLKRVHKSVILLCLVEALAENSIQSVEEYLNKCVPELNGVFESIEVVEVPALPPKTIAQNGECTKKWICNFHPNKYLEKLISKSFFNDKELTNHRLYMSVAFEIANHIKHNLKTEDLMLSDINAAVIVDPTINSIVAISNDNRQAHPIQHAAMTVIDNVAKTQNGGAWTKDNTEDIIPFLKSKFSDVKFDCRQYVSKKDMGDNENSPYLCTGYYVYLIREPCVMCAMGLVHARIKRVFFCYDNVDSGALKTKTKLHCVPSLNHHFEVFSGFC